MRGAWAFFVVALTGCATSSTVPFSKDTLQIEATGGSLFCGKAGVEKIARVRAAIETIRNDYDKFVILDGDYGESQRYEGNTPIQTHSIPNGLGGYTTYTTGGTPIYNSYSQQTYVVKMFKESDPAGAKAFSARNVLGPKWKQLITSNPDSCID